MKHLTEEDLILIYYGEPSVPGYAREHLSLCPECQAASEALARTMSLCNEWSVPEPEPDFARGVWSQIAPRLEDRHTRKLTRIPGWLVGFAVAALIVLAFSIGRVSRPPQPSLTAGLSEQARERILAISLADHLDRAEMLLTEVSNVSDTDPAAFSSERARAQDLIEQGRLMRQTLAEQSGTRGSTATLNLLDDVERFMLELANAPDQGSEEEIRALQQRIASGSLLFKVRIIESNLRTQGKKS